MEATIGATFAGTAHHIECKGEYLSAQAWSRAPTRATLMEHHQVSRFVEALAQAPLMVETPFMCVRGIRFPAGKIPASSAEMGPPPDENLVQADRYNRAREIVLYLSDCEEGVGRELADRTGNLWFQNYSIPSTSLRIVDLTRATEEELIHFVTWFAELAGDDPNPSKLFSQAVAELTARSCDGMIVRGRKGDDSVQYRNLVVFRPSERDRWKAWLQPGSPPRPARA